MIGRILIVVGLVAVAGLGISLMSNNSCDAADGTCGVGEESSSSVVRADDILNEVRSGEARLIDVREDHEYQAGHAIEAELVPLGDIMNSQFEETDKGKKIYLYCRSGNRAGQALEKLKSQGYTNVVNLGGVTDWQQIGGEIAQPHET